MALSHTLGTSFVLMNPDESTVTYARQSVGNLRTVYAETNSTLASPETLVISHTSGKNQGITVDRHLIQLSSMLEDEISGVEIPIVLNLTIAMPRIAGEDPATHSKRLVMRLMSLLYGTAADADLEAANVFAGGTLASVVNNFS